MSRGYKKAAARYYRRRNVQAKRRRRRKFTKPKKLSVNRVRAIAKQAARKLDKQQQFKNQIDTVWGDYHDDPSQPNMFGRVNGLIQLTLQPQVQKIITFDTAANLIGRKQLVVPHMKTTEVANDDPLKDRLTRRSSDKIYVTGFQFQGAFKLPQGNPEDIVQICIVECRTNARHQSEVDTENEYDDKIRLDALPTLSGFTHKTFHEAPLFRKTQKVLVNKVIKLRNSQPMVASKMQQFKLKYFFPKPKMVQYMESDISGLHPLNVFWYLSVRSQGKYDNVGLLTDGTYQVQATAYSPEIIGTFKVYYHDKGT